MSNIEVTLAESGAGFRGRGAGALVRALVGRSQFVRSLVKSARAQHQIQTWRAASVLRGRGRFLLRQLLGCRVGAYALRRSGLEVHLRHRSGDVLILNKIFARKRQPNSYDPPPELAAALDDAPAPRILDVGGNIGLFGLFALGRWPAARITAYEPDPDNCRLLRQNITSNQAAGHWHVVNAAVANAPGELRFVDGRGAKAHLAGAGEEGSISVPAVDLFDESHPGGYDLVKMDCEGGEWAILADPRLRSFEAAAIRLEWHALHCPAPEPHAEAIRLLRAAGFTRILDADHEHERNGVLWAWRAPR